MVCVPRVIRVARFRDVRCSAAVAVKSERIRVAASACGATDLRRRLRAGESRRPAGDRHPGATISRRRWPALRRPPPGGSFPGAHVARRDPRPVGRRRLLLAADLRSTGRRGPATESAAGDLARDLLGDRDGSRLDHVSPAGGRRLPRWHPVQCPGGEGQRRADSGSRDRRHAARLAGGDRGRRGDRRVTRCASIWPGRGAPVSACWPTGAA